MGTQTNYEFRGEQDMNTQKELNDDEVRVIKISKEALFEFIYEKFIDDQDLYLDVDPLDVTNAFDINFERGEFIFCAYKSEDPHGRIVVLPSDIDLQQLMKTIPDTTSSMYAGTRYRQYTKTELIQLSKTK